MKQKVKRLPFEAGGFDEAGYEEGPFDMFARILK